MNDPHSPTRPSAATAVKHAALTPNSAADLAISPQALYIAADGDLEIIDRSGVALVYAVKAGQILPFTPARIGAATTCTVYGWF